MNKRRRQERKERNKQKNLDDISKAKSEGRIIKDNHGHDYYDVNYSIDTLTNLFDKFKNSDDKNFKSLLFSYRKLIINTLMYSKPTVFNLDEYKYFKHLIENYWEESHDKR